MTYKISNDNALLSILIEDQKNKSTTYIGRGPIGINTLFAFPKKSKDLVFKIFAIMSISAKGMQMLFIRILLNL